MKHLSDTVQTICAFLVALIALGLAILLFDRTPLLVEPSPDLDWVLGLLGIGAGLWSASRLTRLPYVSNRRLGRVALWIMLPLWLSMGLTALGSRVQEVLSFCRGASRERATVLVAEKNRTVTRSGRVIYEAGVRSPFDKRVVTLRIDEATFNRIEPYRECVTILVARAPNGAARLLMPLRWKVQCPR